MDFRERKEIYGVVKELSKLKKEAENLDKVVNDELEYLIFTEKLRMLRDQLKRLADL